MLDHRVKQTRRKGKKKLMSTVDIIMFSLFILFIVWWILMINTFTSITDHTSRNKSPKEVMKFMPGRLDEVALPQYPVDHRSLPTSLSVEAIDMCHRTLWHTLETTAYVLPNDETVIITGDIDDLWLRDSAAQIHPLLVPNIHDGKSLVQTDAKLERIVSGLIKRTAMYIRFDPYANAFHIDDSKTFNKFETEQLGRHGFVATYNYELDSACYYMRMLYFFHKSFPKHPIMMEQQTQDAVEIMIDVWIAEQRHEEDQFATGPLFDCKHCGKPYRYNPAELKRQGKGTETNPNTGMTWSGFRPSDDACEYGYLVPANMFAVVVLQYMEYLATSLWHNTNLAKKAKSLRDDIERGIQEHAIVEHEKYGLIYAYEVDGLGNSLLMDDANIPNLMSLPYLGYEYDPEIYENTKRFIMSKDNPTFHEGTNPITGDIGGIDRRMIASAFKIISGPWPLPCRDSCPVIKRRKGKPRWARGGCTKLLTRTIHGILEDHGSVGPIHCLHSWLIMSMTN